MLERNGKESIPARTALWAGIAPCAAEFEKIWVFRIKMCYFPRARTLSLSIHLSRTHCRSGRFFCGVCYVDIVIFIWIFVVFYFYFCALQMKWHIIGCCYCCLLKTHCTWSLISLCWSLRNISNVHIFIFERERKLQCNSIESMLLRDSIRMDGRTERERE